MVPDEQGNWVAQLRRGAAEARVLSLLPGKERYGFELARALTDNALVASEGTIYLLLTRLRRQGLVEPTCRESTEGPPPRPGRYHRLTEDGQIALASLANQWKVFRVAVVRGHREVPTDGHLGSPLMAKKSPHSSPVQ
ncbi:MAG: PadR family transcriptional regulator [Actinomycetota bacterium]|nr:PadR family transcriptional regulator [Actinomycetota bacterium]